MKKFVLVFFAMLAINAFAADTVVKGYLYDSACAADDAMNPGAAADHSSECLKMKDCVRSGYGVLTQDKKYIKFDKAGNAEAKKFIADLKKKKDLRVAVTGEVTGDTMTVSKIELQ